MKSIEIKFKDFEISLNNLLNRLLTDEDKIKEQCYVPKDYNLKLKQYSVFDTWNQNEYEDIKNLIHEIIKPGEDFKIYSNLEELLGVIKNRIYTKANIDDWDYEQNVYDFYKKGSDLTKKSILKFINICKIPYVIKLKEQVENINNYIENRYYYLYYYEDIINILCYTILAYIYKKTYQKNKESETCKEEDATQDLLNIFDILTEFIANSFEENKKIK